MGRAVGDQRTAARALCLLGRIEMATHGRPGRARVLLEESARLALAAGDHWSRGLALGHVVWSWVVQSAIEPGRERRATSRSAIESGDHWQLAWHWLCIALLAVRAGDLGDATAAARRARILAGEVDDAVCLAWTTYCAAEIGSWQGRADTIPATVAGLEAEFGLSERSTLAAAIVHLANGTAAAARGDLSEADRQLTMGVEVAPARSAWPASICLAALGDIAQRRGQVERAEALEHDIREHAARLDNRWLLATSVLLAGRAAQRRGDLGRAGELYREALTWQHSSGFRLDILVTLDDMAALCVERGEPRKAAVLVGAVTMEYRCLGARRRRGDLVRHGADRRALVQALGTRALRRALRTGHGLSVEDAMAYAAGGRAPRHHIGWASLTPIEQTVVRLVNSGLTNPQIADRLLIAPATVKTHLIHIFAKLGVSRRGQLAALAPPTGLRREHPKSFPSG